MAQKNRQCLACHTRFSFCPDCSGVDRLAPSWRSQFCSESCQILWSTLTKFGMGNLTKQEAKEIISALDLKPIDSYVECVQRDYAKVMAEDKKPRKAKKPTIEIVVGDPVVGDFVIPDPIVDLPLVTIDNPVEPTLYEVVNEKTENE